MDKIGRHTRGIDPQEVMQTISRHPPQAAEDGEAYARKTVSETQKLISNQPTRVKVWFAGLIVVWFVGIALTPANAYKAKEFTREFAWAMDAYIAALLFFGWLVWRYNRRVFPVKRRTWDRSFLCRRCGDVARHTHNGATR